MPSDLREGEEIRRDDMGKGGSSTSQSGVYMGYILWWILPLRRLMRAYEGLTSSPEGWNAMADSNHCFCRDKFATSQGGQV